MPEAKRKLKAALSRLTSITESDREYIGRQANNLEVEAFVRGVQRGYEKIISDHRDGFINLSTATRSQIDEAVRLAQQEKLSPGEYFA